MQTISPHLTSSGFIVYRPKENVHKVRRFLICSAYVYIVIATLSGKLEDDRATGKTEMNLCLKPAFEVFVVVPETII